MAKKTTASRAPAAEKDVTAVQGVASADAGSTPPGTASLPSGGNGPEGSILEGVVLPPDTAHTPESESGDADVPELSGAESPNGDDTGTAPVTAPTSEVPASTSETADALDVRSLKHVLEVTGCADLDDLIDMANAGQSAHLALAKLIGSGDPDAALFAVLEPAEVIEQLFEIKGRFQQTLNTLSAAAEPDNSGKGKRRFIVCERVSLNGVMAEIGKTLDLTEDEHVELLAAGAIASTWEKGFTV
ncbi:hypothetical protein [Rhizobium sp. CC-YZS058]|uniref:hypothetical protein n=1 Tax=Rhizobium sp. CC-YZS058 TaxID=3042153 RepID=UPI002B053D2E|nr:hypothetical protein [Rhizobium sp. CC-YZS058]MEA3533721.1 hypothetical protein [Rhizobium sp. CC-YZS058]